MASAQVSPGSEAASSSDSSGLNIGHRDITFLNLLRICEKDTLLRGMGLAGCLALPMAHSACGLIETGTTEQDTYC